MTRSHLWTLALILGILAGFGGGRRRRRKGWNRGRKMLTKDERKRINRRLREIRDIRRGLGYEAASLRVMLDNDKNARNSLAEKLAADHFADASKKVLSELAANMKDNDPELEFDAARFWDLVDASKKEKGR